MRNDKNKINLAVEQLKRWSIYIDENGKFIDASIEEMIMHYFYTTLGLTDEEFCLPSTMKWEKGRG